MFFFGSLRSEKIVVNQHPPKKCCPWKMSRKPMEDVLRSHMQDATLGPWKKEKRFSHMVGEIWWYTMVQCKNITLNTANFTFVFGVVHCCIENFDHFCSGGVDNLLLSSTSHHAQDGPLLVTNWVLTPINGHKMGNWGLTPINGVVTLLATGRVKQQWPQTAG